MGNNSPFSVTYLGPVDYYRHLLKQDRIIIEKHESWIKQTYRNRCYIDGPNGRLMLNIPVRHGKDKKISSMEISYADNWHLKHWQAIKTTYSSSPFFEVLGPELKAVYDQKILFLFELNIILTRLILEWLQADKKITFTESWQAYNEDLRDAFHPKRESGSFFPKYPQVFDDKHGFLPNLSIIDLIFNEGPAAYDYLFEDRKR